MGKPLIITSTNPTFGRFYFYLRGGQIDIGKRLGVWEVVQEDWTDHTNLFPRSFIGFGLTRHQKVRWELDDGDLTMET